ncbi:hypothetical protein HHU12_33700 [Flammeovirga aprica JL-4]|uniref:Toxin-antitoxin system YwqK family antitoxin n=1 Tax=Flammeovirga aprica JL-4 TaxID=694437 RepID=A0A7X9S242_9BACT|nr:hypothetical protein [Flammeovirga aprica JL-4]
MNLNHPLPKGNMEGEYLFYFQNGKIEMVGDYLDGQKVGEWITYDKEGNILSKENFKVTQ